jgi:hypothetical protein
MSGLSARVSSCGGEGSLLGRGGEAFGGGAAFLVAFFALWKMGASFLTSSSGADESPLLSESDIVAEVGGVVIDVVASRESRRRSWWCLRTRRSVQRHGQPNRERSRMAEQNLGRKREGGAAMKHSEDRMFTNWKDIYGISSLQQLSWRTGNIPCFSTVSLVN